MVKSMTGYGRSEIVSDMVEGYVEIISKNHRYRDIKISLPKKLLFFEINLKNMLSDRILRGKVDLILKLKSNVRSNVSLSLDEHLLGEYKKIIDKLEDTFKKEGQLDIVNLANLDGLVVVEESEDDLSQYLPDIETAVSKALDGLDEMRTFEGDKLMKELVTFMSAIEEMVNKIELKRSELVGQYYEKVKDKISNLIENIALDEQRVYQEVAYIIDKTDIAEELSRLKSHLSQFKNIIKEEGSLGKKLDFLFQELVRETNTIASKANDFDITAIVVKMKNEIEKAREQAQNIE